MGGIQLLNVLDVIYMYICAFALLSVTFWDQALSIATAYFDKTLSQHQLTLLFFPDVHASFLLLPTQKRGVVQS